MKMTEEKKTLLGKTEQEHDKEGIYHLQKSLHLKLLAHFPMASQCNCCTGLRSNVYREPCRLLTLGTGLQVKERCYSQ